MLANLPYVAVGLALVFVIAGGVWWFKHRPVRVAGAVGKTAVDSFVAGMEAPLEDLKADFAAQLAGIPALVSSEVAELQGQVADLTQERDQLAAALAQEKASTAAKLNAVAARVSNAIAASPELASAL